MLGQHAYEADVDYRCLLDVEVLVSGCRESALKERRGFG